MGNTALSKIITGATGDNFSHASIAFSPSLDPLYSFGTKKLAGKSRDLGFVITNPHSNLWGTASCNYELYVTFINKENYDKIQSRLQYFVQNQNSLKYDFSGLVRIFFHKESKSEKKYFCSRFVAELLNIGNIINDSPSLYRPDTLKGIGRTCLMMRGDAIQSFDETDAVKAFEKVKKAPDSVTSIVD